MFIHVTTLTDYLAEHHTTPAVKSVIATITHACEEISELLKRGALADILGEVGNQNVQGEEQKNWT